jgi:hypothetical protein
MNEKKFWQLIAQIDREALEDGDAGAAVEPLTEALAELPVEDIKGFEECLAQALYKLDGKVFADHAGESGKSDDAFLYARCFVVGSGKTTYDSVLADPALMPDQTDDWLEELLSVAPEAWSGKTGRDTDDWDFSASVDYETGSNSAAWAG